MTQLNEDFLRAVKDGNVEGAKFYLRLGADVNAIDTNAPEPLDSPALIRASSNEHLAMIKLLLAAGADINVSDKTGWTALIWAVTYGNIDIVRILLRKGADIYHRSYLGRTALYYAINKNHIKIVTLLKEYGAEEGGSTCG